MKHRGPCRIRVEPQIFEADLYVEEKPRPPPPKPQQQAGYGAGGYGQPYRPGQAQPPYGQQRAIPSAQKAQTPMSQSPAPTTKAQQSTPQPQQNQDKKPGQDPVITMLASRASSNMELKALMREVATGNANPEQLKIFQSHIDDLTKIIAEKKKQEDEEEAAAQVRKASQQQQDAIQYDGANDGNNSQQQTVAQPQAPILPQYRQQQPVWQPPPVAPQPPQKPVTHPVVLQFTAPGATEDRFLFPQHSILEVLSPQHLLCSFIATRRGLDAADTAGLASNTEYYQPITFMMEVAYGRESLMELVKKWVLPADEVRKHMEETMQRCTRAPEAWLAMRLPIKGAEGAETEEERAEEEVKVVEEVRRKSGSNVKYIKKPPAPKKEESAKKGSGAASAASAEKAAGASGKADGKAEKKENAAKTGGDVANADEAKNDGEDTGRPRRAVRKSVRISEG